MTELKRCPFCGGEAVLQSGGDNQWWWLECESGFECVAGFVRGAGGEAGREAVISAWNRRALPSRDALIGILENVGCMDCCPDLDLMMDSEIAADLILALLRGDA